MQAHTPIFKNEGIRPGPGTPPPLPHGDIRTPPPLPVRPRFSGRNLALGVVGLALFATMGYMLGNFILAMNLKWPWYFPH